MQEAPRHDRSDFTTRGIIYEGSKGSFEHLIPLAEFLIARGHKPLANQNWHGFFRLARDYHCWLGRRITPEDWQAVQDYFTLPESVVYQPGIIRDVVSGTTITGWNRVILDDGLQPVEVWEKRDCPEIRAEPVNVDNTAKFEAVKKDHPEWERQPDLRSALEAFALGPMFPVGIILRCFFMGLAVYGEFFWWDTGDNQAFGVFLFLFFLLAPVMVFPSLGLEILRGSAVEIRKLRRKKRSSTYYEGPWGPTLYAPEAMGAHDPRELIANGTPHSYLHLVPLVRALGDLGHQLVDHLDTGGFRQTDSYAVCRVSGRISTPDWDRLGERFNMPHIYFRDGQIIDATNDVYVMGVEEVPGNRSGYQPAGLWDWPDELPKQPAKVSEPEATQSADGRQIIPAGRAKGGGLNSDFNHLRPLAEFLVARGHSVIKPFGEGDYGYRTCSLTRLITGADWIAINERFVVPDDILYTSGSIHDYTNGVEITGTDYIYVDGDEDTFQTADAVECIELWEDSRRPDQRQKVCL